MLCSTLARQRCINSLHGRNNKVDNSTCSLFKLLLCRMGQQAYGLTQKDCVHINVRSWIASLRSRARDYPPETCNPGLHNRNLSIGFGLTQKRGPWAARLQVTKESAGLSATATSLPPLWPGRSRSILQQLLSGCTYLQIYS